MYENVILNNVFRYIRKANVSVVWGYRLLKEISPSPTVRLVSVCVGKVGGWNLPCAAVEREVSRSLSANGAKRLRHLSPSYTRAQARTHIHTHIYKVPSSFQPFHPATPFHFLCLLFSTSPPPLFRHLSIHVFSSTSSRWSFNFYFFKILLSCSILVPLSL